MNDFVVRAHRLSKRFRLQPGQPMTLRERFSRKHDRSEDFWPLRDVSFELRAGEALGIVGRNGAGKSTALKVLAGIYRPTGGTLEMRGRVSTLLELGAGFHPELTGRENIRLNGTLMGLSREHVEESMERVIKFAGLEDFIDTPMKVYSSGMKLRLGYSVAIQIEPDILIVDEIIAVGDATFRQQCAEHMAGLRDRGTTMIIASHSMTTLEDLCERTMWLDGGVVRELGPTSEVIPIYEQVMLDNALTEAVEQGVLPEEMFRR